MRLFAGLAVLAFVVSTFGSDVVSRVLAGDASLEVAALEHVRFAAAQPVGSLMLFAPFAVAALLSLAVSARAGVRRGLALFGFTAATLLVLYYLGYDGARMALSKELWTAAALSVGLLPFLSVPILIVAAVAGFALVRTAAGRALSPVAPS